MKQASSQPLFAEGGVEALRGSEACPASRGAEAEGPDSDLGHLVPGHLASAWDRLGIVSSGEAERGDHHHAGRSRVKGRGVHAARI